MSFPPPGDLRDRIDRHICPPARLIRTKDSSFEALVTDHASRKTQSF
jgi:hypothetical protein